MLWAMEEIFLKFTLVFFLFAGLRQGIMLSKIGLVLMLSRFDFEATVPRKVRFEPANVTLTPDGGLPMKITVRGDRAKVQ